MNRRRFLAAMAGLAVAPAIVNAENIMKLWTPNKNIITNPYEFAGDQYTLESWMKNGTDIWYHIAITRNADGTLTKYVDGRQVQEHEMFQQFDYRVIPIMKEMKGASYG